MALLMGRGATGRFLTLFTIAANVPEKGGGAGEANDDK